jgi:polyvinyl alcohol dehydrogenase (cytochrome)
LASDSDAAVLPSVGVVAGLVRLAVSTDRRLSCSSWIEGGFMRIKSLLALVAGLAAMAVAAPAAIAAPPSWPMASQSVQGNRNQSTEDQINPGNVGHLKPKWVFTDHGDVSATPTVAGGAVYFPDFGGYINAVNANTGKLIWQRTISSYGGAGVSRNSPLVLGNDIIFGDNASFAQQNGAHLFAVDRSTGNLIWSTQVDSNQAAVITSNPVNVGNEIVVGVASNEEFDATQAGYPCCSFRGAVVALNATTGQIMWKTYTIPSSSSGGDSNQPCAAPNGPSGCDYSGGAVWGTPTINPQTNQVFVGTGNNYTAPDSAVACESAAQANNTSDATCTAPDDFFDAVLALNLTTGQIEWGHKVEGWDAWNVACAFEPIGVTWCPSPASPDYDFGGSSPNLFTVTDSNGKSQTLVGNGQKSGVYWAFDPATGATVWQTLVGPGSSLGGIEWGSAYDGQRIYTTEANLYGIPYQLAGSSQTVDGGSWAALDPQTGKIDWQTEVPGDWLALGPVSSANGVVFGASMNPSATSGADMFALNASTGKILWSFNAGSSVNAGPAIVGGTVYWGTGYAHLGIPPFDGNNKFYAFSANGS